MKDSEIGNIASLQNISAYCTYIASNRPANDEIYLFGGGSYTIIGMEYGNSLYGYQMAIGIGAIKKRDLSNGIWTQWKTVSLA